MKTFLPLGVEKIAKAFPKYQVHHLIGVGGMGEVYQATQISLERVVAIKILPPQFLRDSALRALFAEAAKAMARLNHPNLIAVHDFGEALGIPYVIMEYVDGCPLHRSTKGKAINSAAVVRIISGVCAGLAYAHQNGVVHGDIKPANILLTQEVQPKIGDFGLARRAGRLSQDDTPVFGTVHYSAPEVPQMAGDWDARVDVFSVGIVLHELLTGRYPADDPRPASEICGCDNRFDTIIRRATMADPALRYSSIEEMVDEVAAVSAGSNSVQSAAGRVPQADEALADDLNSPASPESSGTGHPTDDTRPRNPPDPRKKAVLWVGLGLVGLLISIGIVIMRPSHNAPTAGRPGEANGPVPLKEPGADAEMDRNIPATPQSDGGVNIQPAIVKEQPAEQPQAEPSIASEIEEKAGAGKDAVVKPVPNPDAVAIDSGFRLLIDTRGDGRTSAKISSIVNTKIKLEVSESELTPEKLGHVTHIVIAADMPSRPFSTREIAALRNFVARGNVLICAAQTWYWANQSEKIHPVNELGRYLGFGLKGATGDPLRICGTPGLLKGSDVGAAGYVLSIVDTNGLGTNLIVTSGNAPVAVDLPFGKGRILVFGHARYLRDHPGILLKSLNLPSEASKDPVWTSFLAELDGLDEAIATAMTSEGTATAALEKKYRAALDRLKKSAPAAGKNESILAVNEALGRLESGENPAGISKDPAVRELERIYLENLPAARALTVKSMIEATSARFARLDTLVSDMGRTGKTGDASAARSLVAQAKSRFDASVKEANQPIQRGRSQNIAPPAPAAGPATLSSVQIVKMINDFNSQFPPTMRKRCSKADRLQRLKDTGGTPECEDAVVKALDWLKSTQSADGSWTGSHKPAMTGLALLAYLGHCETPVSEKYGETVLRGMTYLINVGMRNQGKLTTNAADKQWPYEHAIATYALAEAATFCKALNIDIPNLMEVTRMAGQFIIDNQHDKTGGWDYHYDTKGKRGGDLSITAWHVQALKACHHAGLEFKGLARAMNKAMHYVESMSCNDGGFAYAIVNERYHALGYRTMTGAGVLSLQMGEKGAMSPARRGAWYISKNTKFDYNGIYSDLYGHYYEAQAMMNRGGKDWRDYNTIFRDQVLINQNPDGSWKAPNTGPNKGSIRAVDPEFVGNVHYRTCLCTLMLEVYYRFTASLKEPSVTGGR